MDMSEQVILIGDSNHVLDEADRSLHDALSVLSQTVNDSRVLLGGGWPEMVMANAMNELARKTPGKKSHAIEAFSRALIAIPTIIADNAGLDNTDFPLPADQEVKHYGLANALLRWWMKPVIYRNRGAQSTAAQAITETKNKSIPIFGK
ncbi:hypothetical protein RHSIM_Rhsim02G0162100 [Rhododendron simsii]|uniref:TCP-1/cpn60 chaperonin family protein n=1 Tax=Rhododendron simsii TaxID=118357 RepID=A0A834HD61_RHOSS|nr:hypothetical protein RHSIM_Rhsim02G0162100 [Rhododendron simsii]